MTSVATLGVGWLFALELLAERARVTRRTSLTIHRSGDGRPETVSGSALLCLGIR